MDIFSVLTMIGGLAIFLYGMNTMGDGLVKLSGGKLEKILEKLTQNRLMALALGALVTAVIQSSSATTVMVVGFVNSEIMNLTQAVGVIMGANVGTTITSWMLSLTGIQGDSVFLKLLKPSSFSPVLAAIGIILTMTDKESGKKKDIGMILLGFAVLMFGMETMSGAVAPLADNEKFTGMLTAFSNPLLGMAAGALLTAVIQSSSASVGILQALCMTGAVTYGAALPIIMGQNIGTCVTAMLSSVGASKNARRAAIIHLLFNLIGTLLFMALFYAVNAFVDFAFLDIAANPAGIAVIHTIFNVSCAIVLFPFAKVLVRLATIAVPDHSEGDVDTDAEGAIEMPAALLALDERFLGQADFAMSLCVSAADEMSRIAARAMNEAMDVLHNYSDEKAAEVLELENEADKFEDVLGTYLVKLSSKDLSRDASRKLSILLHSISDFERISDHAINVVESAQELKAKKMTLSDESLRELEVYGKALRDIIEMTTDAFVNGDSDKAKGIEPLEEVIDNLSIEMRQRHIDRLRSGKCHMEAGLILEDILTNYERVSDHCSNVGVCLIEVGADEFETHGYLNLTIKGDDHWFQDEFMRLKQLYMFPK